MKISLRVLRPDLALLVSLFVGGLVLAASLTSIPVPAHIRATTLSECPRKVTFPCHCEEPFDRLRMNSACYQEIASFAMIGGFVNDRGHLKYRASGQGDAAIRSSDVLTTYVYLPLVTSTEVCQPIPGESYGDLAVGGAPTDRPAEEHPDLNLALRGYELTDAYAGLVDYSGGSDPNAPQLPGLLADGRTATFSAVYQVYDWDWGSNRRGALLTDPEVTLAGLVVTPSETIHVPDSGYAIGDYEVLVLYASPERITLKYTPDDNVVGGYTLHVENVCVEPNLLALYQSWNEAGRGHLPALRAGQAFGRASGSEIGVAVRDGGTFMDPRSRKDWWQGRLRTSRDDK